MKMLTTGGYLLTDKAQRNRFERRKTFDGYPQCFNHLDMLVKREYKTIHGLTKINVYPKDRHLYLQKNN